MSTRICHLRGSGGGPRKGGLGSTDERAHTRTDHLALAAQYLGWKIAAAGSTVLKELEQFLLDRAMEHDSPTSLFNLAREYRPAAKAIRSFRRSSPGRRRNWTRSWRCSTRRCRRGNRVEEAGTALGVVDADDESPRGRRTA
ncbi:DUF4158 domain-containing protein [Actinoallomurus sp. NBC_01490]